MESIWTIVLAGGSGARFGGQKQFETLDGISVLDRSISAAVEVSDGVVVVLPAGAHPLKLANALTAVGGATRSESTRNGLAMVPEDADIIVVHDAARPLASKALYNAVIEEVRCGADGALPGFAVSDTIKQVAGNRVVTTVAREHLVAVQTPQAFRGSVLRRAHAAAEHETDDAALVERLGGKTVVVPGDPRNIKITLPGDVTIARALMETM